MGSSDAEGSICSEDLEAWRIREEEDRRNEIWLRENQFSKEEMGYDSNYTDFEISERSSLERATKEALSKAMSGIGAQDSGMEAAKSSERGEKLARGSEREIMSSDGIVARAEGCLSRVNVVLSRDCLSENGDVTWLTSLLDGVSIPKPSARTRAEVEYTSEPSDSRFRECEDLED